MLLLSQQNRISTYDRGELEIATLTIRPNAGGDLTQNNYFDGTEHAPDPAHNFEQVDEAVADDNSTYVYHTAPAETPETTYDLYNLANHVAEAGVINSVKLYLRGAGTYPLKGGTTATPYIKIGGTAHLGTPVMLGWSLDWEDIDDTWAENPTTEAAWTWGDIDALQAGLKMAMNAATQHTGKCTQVYVVIDYDLIPPFVDLLCKAEIGQNREDLLGKADIQREVTIELLGKFEVQATVELLGRAVIRHEAIVPSLYFSEEQTVQTGWSLTYGGGREGQRLIIDNRTVTKLAFYMYKIGSPSGDLVFTIRRVSDDSIIVSKIWGDAADLPTELTWEEVTFDSPATIQEEVRILFEFDGGDADNYVRSGHSDDDLKGGEYYTYWSSLNGFDWTDLTDQDFCYKYTYTPIELLGIFEVSQEGLEDLYAKFVVEVSGSADLLAKADILLPSRDLIAKFVIPAIYSITGVTRDKEGSRLGNCEVALFKVTELTTYLFMASGMSDANGDYSFGGLTKSKYFVRGQKDGSPNVFDTTDNEVVPF